MRGLNNEEWENFHGYVKCDFRTCAGGGGLAGNGHCSFSGEWDRADCPKFITDEEFERYDFYKGGSCV